MPRPVKVFFRRFGRKARTGKDLSDCNGGGIHLGLLLFLLFACKNHRRKVQGAAFRSALRFPPGKAGQAIRDPGAYLACGEDVE
jgi:hypothetical protein